MSGDDRRALGSPEEILESIDEAFYALDRDWRFIYINRAAARMWGRERDDLIGRVAFEAFPVFRGSEIHHVVERVLAEGKPRRVEAVSAVLNRLVEVNAFPSPSGVTIYFRDVSERRRLEQELRERSQILSLAELSAGIGVWDIDLASGLVHGTPQFFGIYGLDPASQWVPLETMRGLRHPDDGARVVEGFRRAVSSGADAYEMEYRIIRPDGQTRWVFGRGRVVRDAAGEPVRYSGIDIDVTDRKAAQAALIESQARLRLAHDAVGIGTWDWDIVSGDIRWSDTQWRLYGMPPSGAGPSYDAWKTAIHPDDRDRAHAALADAVATKGGYEAEYRVVHPDGTVRWLAARGTVVTDEAGRPIRLLGVNADVTDRRLAAEALERVNRDLEIRVRERSAELEAEASRRIEAEAQLHQAQKMEAVGQLTGGIAHDFNNLLTVVIGNLDMARRRLRQGTLAPGEQLQARVEKSIDMALQGANAAAQLTHRLLAFSRQQMLEPRPLEINQLVVGMSDMIGRTLSETIQVETTLADPLWLVFADAHQLETALLNLIVNARDAMPQGGRVVVGTANVRFAESHGGGADTPAAGEYVMLSVTDTGMGVPKENIEKVFEPFFTTKETGKGSGLGLSMVYGFVKQSGGHVRLESEPGKGTSVKLYLPRLAEVGKPETAPAGRSPSSELPRASARETILLVEDNDAVRRYAVNVLRDLGYQILEAHDAESAQRLLATEPAPRIDLLFTDLVLPGGTTGRTLSEKCRERYFGLPILFTTGYAARSAVRPNGTEPDVQLLTKPYTPDALARKIREVLDAAPAAENVIMFKSPSVPST
jgi:PAS domain S-box-containing protein